MQKIRISFGRHVKALREDRNFTSLRQAAKDMKLSPSWLSRIESGQQIASKETIIKLAKYYKVDELELFFRAGRVPNRLRKQMVGNPEKWAKIVRDNR